MQSAAPGSSMSSDHQESAFSGGDSGREAKRRWHERHPIVITYKWARRIAIAIVGFTVLVVGLAMVVLPGPAFVVIPVGLGILSLEFAWARHWLTKIKEGTASVVQSVSKRRNGSS